MVRRAGLLIVAALALVAPAACSDDDPDAGPTTSSASPESKGARLIEGSGEVALPASDAVEAFVGWARGRTGRAPAFAGTVTLVWGHARAHEFGVTAPDDLASWSAPALGYEGRDGALDPLRLIATSGDLEYSSGPHPHCDAAAQPLVDVDGPTVVTLQPVDVDRCADWFAVDLVLDDQHQITEVILDLWSE
jgi:hypothetical protein